MSEQKQKNTVRQKKNSSSVSTQLFLNIAEIKDNVVVLKNGGLRAVLKTSSINFNLKSEEEQNSIIYAYQNFLNSLDFPIQILIQSKKLNIDKYIDNVKETANKHDSELLKTQTLEYADYVEKLIEYADIMEKNFYVIIPYNPFRIQNKNMLSKFMQNISSQDSIDNIKRRHHEFNELNKHLSERVNITRNGLEACNLRIAQLNTIQLIELFYKTYNSETSKNEPIEDLDKIDINSI